MKMTRQEVVDLLLNMNEDCSNVEYLDNYNVDDGIDAKWCNATINTVKLLLSNISSGIIYRIKDNAVKEVTPALLGAKCKHRNGKGWHSLITGINNQNGTIETSGEYEYDLKQFNEQWQLVED